MVRTLVFDWWTFPDLRLPVFGWHDHFVGKVSAMGSTNQANAAVRLFRVGKWVVIHIIVWITRPLNSRPGLHVALWLQDQSHVCTYTLHATLCVTQSAAAAAVCSLWCYIGDGPVPLPFMKTVYCEHVVVSCFWTVFKLVVRVVGLWNPSSVLARGARQNVAFCVRVSLRHRRLSRLSRWTDVVFTTCSVNVNVSLYSAFSHSAFIFLGALPTAEKASSLKGDQSC